MDERVGERAFQQCSGAGERVRLGVGGQRVRGLGDGVEADDDHPVDAEAQRRPDRCVQPGHAVEIPAAGRCRLRYMHGREQGRDRRRGADVFVG